MHLFEAKPLHFCAELIAKLCKFFFLMSLAFQKGIACENPFSGSGLKNILFVKLKNMHFVVSRWMKIRRAILAPI